MKKTILFISLTLLPFLRLLAQPANDDCAGAIQISDVTNYCSPSGGFSNVGATPSLYEPASCFGPTTQNDVWFKFTATATDVTVTVRGATAQGAGGTLKNPQVAIYFGSCGGVINQLECQTAPGTSNIAEGYQGGLFVGSTYFIRVQGGGGATGTFQLCINNYNPPVDPTSDCPEASILCDKSSFVVQSVTGAGKNVKEMDDATCFFNGSPTNIESNSTWFVWTCSKSGTLEFTLTPTNASDDLDFALYRLPNGIGNCAGKQLVRCMASGDFNSVTSPCMGPTGLRPGDPDVSEDAGCSDAGDNAWLSPFDMVQGETYVLAVNNFTSTGNGFSIDFGGTGEFLGPTAQFETVPKAVCLGTPVQVTDMSNFPIGSITGWEWSFGADAMPQKASGKGPHTVTFNTPGERPVVLRVQTNLGCKVTAIQNVTIYPDVEVDTVIGTPDCNGGTNGTITISNIKMGTPPYVYSWQGGPFVSENSLDSLPVGIYKLKIRDANNCETDLSIPVNEKILTVNADVEPPLCTGQSNGVITLNVTNGTAPFQFDWGNGFISSNSESGFAQGKYTIYGRDAELCKGTFEVGVPDHPQVTLETDFTDVTCFGAGDGKGLAMPAGGVGNFTYKWSDGQTTAEAGQLQPGQYTVTIADANGCSKTAAITIEQPGELNLILLDVVNLLCNGIPTGEIRVKTEGGRPEFSFSPDGINFFPNDTLRNLPAGSYNVLVRDANGCTDSVAATISQPPALVISAFPSDTTLQLGFTVQLTTDVQTFGRSVTYSWTPSTGLMCLDNDPALDCEDPILTATNDQLYVVQIQDEFGCSAYDTVRILVKKDRPVYVPNVIAPDGSYQNSRFTLFAGPAAELIEYMRIYDRWGSLIYEGENLQLGDADFLNGWDGTYKGEPVSGVFVFYAGIRFIDQVLIEYKGDITVVR